jgi:hypothetical protein
MASSLDFTNPGIHFAGIQSPLIEAPPAVVICGLPRSGTTAIAAGFRNAGFDLGSGLSNVIEDQAFRAAILSQDTNRVRQYFGSRHKYSRTLPVCVKYPDAYKSMPLISKSLPGVVFLVATRDPFCVAMRNNISMFADFSTFFRKSTNEYSRMYESVMEASGASPVLIVAYEKLLSSPALTFETVFTSILPGSANIVELAGRAKEAIQLNPDDYLAESNIKPCYSIDFSSVALSGYCYFKASPDRKVIIEVLSDNKLLSEIVCDLPREGLGADHPNGMCGFYLSFTDIGVDDISKIKVRIKGTSHQLA